MKSKILDIAEIERPVLTKKPEKPKKPNLVLVEKTKTEKKIFWSSSTAGKTFKILDVLKNVPKDVDLNDVQVWCEAKLSGSYYNQKASSSVYIGSVKEFPNPKHVAANTKYENELVDYNEKLVKWEVEQAEYDDKLELYKKYKDLIDVRDQKAALMKKLTALVAKDPMKVVPVVTLQ